MNTSPSPTDRTTALVTVWAIAGLAAILAIAMMIFFGDFGYTGPVFLGGILFVALGFFLQFQIADLPPPPPVGAFDMPGSKSAPAPKATPKPAPKPAADKAETPASADASGKPALLSAARGGTADDLKQIKGVGPKLEEALNAMGVYHLDQIAGWSDAEVAWVDENLEGFKGRVSRDDWVAQARELTAG